MMWNRTSVAAFLLAGTASLAGSGAAFAQSPGACDVLSEQDAVSLAGGPLGEVFRRETRPTPENGNDHTTVCGYFPKGYDIQKGDRPPERGLLLTLHTMRNKADAKSFYDNSTAMHMEMAKTPGSPTAGSKVTMLAGVAEAAMVVASTIRPDSGPEHQIVTVQFLKGSVSGQVQAWKKGASPRDAAVEAAKRAAGKLR